MKIINFIGHYSKTELMLYVAKLIQSVNNYKVLFIDSVVTQKCRCIIPAIVNDNQYITTYEQLDIAIGFNSHKEIVKYLNEQGEDFNSYDYVFIDTDTEQMCADFELENANNTFCITSYDKYDILKTVGLINEIDENKKEYIDKIKMKRIYVYTLLSTSDARYIDHSFDMLDIKWKGQNIYIPYDLGDTTVLIQNQYSEKLKIKELSKEYKQALKDIALEILGEDSKNTIQKVLKNIERRV